MTATTVYRPTGQLDIFPNSGSVSLSVAASTTIEAGWMVGIDSSGDAISATATGCKAVIGRSQCRVDNSTGSAGDKFINVDLGTFWWANGDTITKSSISDLAYVSDNQTVKKTPTEAQPAGVIVAIDSTRGVAVAHYFPMQKQLTPNIQSGTSTLSSGTVSVVTKGLTSSSVIQLTMRDPGSGALTTFIALDAPVASRSTTLGTFTVNAIDNAKATLTTAVCTFDWTVIG